MHALASAASTVVVEATSVLTRFRVGSIGLRSGYRIPGRFASPPNLKDESEWGMVFGSDQAGSMVLADSRLVALGLAVDRIFLAPSHVACPGGNKTKDDSCSQRWLLVGH